MALHHLAAGVYAAPGDMRLGRPWVGVVVTEAGTLLIDSGNGPRQAEAIQEGLRVLGAPPVTHILLTHHHWDHVFGSCAFPAAHIVAHELTQPHLQVMADEPWSAAYVEAKGESFPRGKLVTTLMKQAVPDWTTFQVCPAHETFQDRYELEWGGYHVQMQHVGGQHEPDQTTVLVRPGNVLFLGDATYGRASQREWDYVDLARAMQGFLDSGADWFVEGHRAPVRRDGFQRRIERMAER